MNNQLLLCPQIMPWLSLEQEFARHLGVSVGALQWMSEEEVDQKNYEASQDVVRGLSYLTKKEKKEMLANNKKWYKAHCKKRDKGKPKEAVVAEAEADNNNNNSKTVQEGWWKYFNEKGEEISDWDDQRWDEVNAWVF